MGGRHVLRADLNNTGTLSLSQRQHRAKIQVMSEYNVVIGSGPIHQNRIFRAQVPYC